MKVMQIGSNTVHVFNFLDALKNKTVEVCFLGEEQLKIDQVFDQYVVSFRSLNPLSVLRNYRNLKKILKKVNPNCIHIHQINRLAYFVSRAASKLKIPVVSTAWGSDVLLIPKQNAFYRFLVKKTIERSAFVTADATSMIEAMKELDKSEDKYVLLQYGIDFIASGEKEKIIYCNRLHEELYRISDVIRYFEEFHQIYPDWKLIIAAIGSQTEQLKKQCIVSGIQDSIDFIGWANKEQNQLNYKKASIYISIPKSDGTAVSVLEAMSAGCIPVLSDLPVTHEWLEHNVNGIIEKESENPLIAALTLDNNKVSSLNKEKLTKTERAFCTSKFLEIYNQIVRPVA